MVIDAYNRDGTVTPGYTDLIEAYTAAFPDGGGGQRVVT